LKKRKRELMIKRERKRDNGDERKEGRIRKKERKKDR
jgi:hypothetical protein